MAETNAAPGSVHDYLLVESQGQWSGPNAERFLKDAAALAAAGHRVRVLLIQDGVLAAAAAAGGPALARLDALGAEVWLDEFSVAQRALTETKLSPHARVVPMNAVARLLLAAGPRVVWH